MANSCKYYKQQRQVSYDGGISWQNLDEYQKGDLYERNSSSCGLMTVTRWVNTGTTCVGYDKYYLQVKEISYDGGTTWGRTTETATTLAERASIDCIDMTGKLYLSFDSEGRVLVDKECYTGSSTSPNVNIITPQGDSTMVWYAKSIGFYVFLGGCVKSIARSSFAYTELGSIYFHEGGYGFGESIFTNTHIGKVIIGNPNVRFTLGSAAIVDGGTFYKASGDISELLFRTTSIGAYAFTESSFGDRATFGFKVRLAEKAFHYSSFTQLIFNNGFSVGESVSYRDVFSTKGGGKPTITLNGREYDYPKGVVYGLRGEGFTVINNMTL